MKRVIKENLWILFCLFLIVMCFIAYQIVDNPEQVGATTDMYDVPEEIERAAEKYGAEYHVSPELIESMAWFESNYNPYDVSPTGCIGILQVNPRWHGERMERLGVYDLYDVDGNIHCGVDYLVEILENDTEELAAALAIYNGQSKSNIWAAENEGYISRYAGAIMDFAYELETLHGKHNKAHFDPNTVDWEGAVG